MAAAHADIIYCNYYSTTVYPRSRPFTEVGEQLWKVHFRTPPINAALPADLVRNPYPYFERKREEAGVFHGTVVDYSKTPESMRPENSFATMSLDAVNDVLRDGRIFNSTYYENTIGLFSPLRTSLATWSARKLTASS